MVARSDHKQSLTLDCNYCGETYLTTVGALVPTCVCGCALTLRPVGAEKGAFVLFLQLLRLDEEGIAVSIDELRNCPRQD